MDSETKKSAQPRRRWFRFSLRTLLIVITVLSLPLGWIGWRLQQVRRERATVVWVQKMGGQVKFHAENDERNWWEATIDKWCGGRAWGVSLQGTEVSDLSPLTKLKCLESLVLYNTQVSDLSPLAKLTSLEHLSLSKTQVRDLSPLAELRLLEWLAFHSTQVSDLSPLAKLKNLRSLYLSDTPVDDLSSLLELKNLRSLYLDDTPVNEQQLHNLTQAIPLCMVRCSTRIEE
jgi:hypothetical protein